VDSGFSFVDVVFCLGIRRRTALVRKVPGEIFASGCFRSFYFVMVDVCGDEQFLLFILVRGLAQFGGHRARLTIRWLGWYTMEKSESG
jgi:hypothetical protein